MFRNISNFIPKEVSCTKIFEVHDDKIVEDNLDQKLPCSNDYSLVDMLSAGVKVPPVDPTVVHDTATTNGVAKELVENFVEQSNNDE